MNNPGIKNVQVTILSNHWYTLKKVNFDFQKRNGEWEPQVREAYDRGNGAAILLYNKAQGTVILTRQFRMPTYLNGNDSGLMIEVCAGLLDADNPEDCIRRETEEETGYRVRDLRKVMEAYMSPGSVTEILYLFVAEYSGDHKINDGGGIDDEDIEVLEILFQKALEMVGMGEIKDAKTIMLLQYALIHKLILSS